MELINGRGHGPLNSLTAEFERSLDLISTLDDLIYVKSGSSGVGAQFRHNLDFGLCLINGLATGRIDYSDRKRENRVETDRRYASEQFRGLIDRLMRVDSRVLGKSLMVRSEIDLTTWLPSSVVREVEFVHSHTVHHHALIAEKLIAAGYRIVDTFGVAPSTLTHWKQIAA